MASLSSIDKLTAIEIAKRQGLKETVKIVEALAVNNELILDAPVQEANDGTMNKVPVRTVQPTGQRRAYNEGIQSHASQVNLAEDFVTLIEDYSDVDADLAEHSPLGVTATLEQEDMAFISGIGLTQVQAALYDNRASNPKQFNGLHVRSCNIKAGQIEAMTVPGADGAVTSAFLIGWGLQSVYMFYPRGRSDIGIKREFRGKQDISRTNPDGSTGTMPAYRSFYSVHQGLAVPDPRFIRRICNIKTDGNADGQDFVQKLIKLRNFAPKSASPVQWSLYVNPVVKTALDIYANSKANGCYYADDPFGHKTTFFQDIRVRSCDSILSTENLIA
jgi:hypothetical protein